MSRVWKRKSLKVCLIVIIGYCLYQGVNQLPNMEKVTNNTHIELNGLQKVGTNEAQAIYYENEKSDTKRIDMVFMEQGEEAILENNDINRQTFVKPVYFIGNENILIPNLPQGSIGVGECVIGAQTAYQLFGTSNVVGLKVSLNEEEYKIVNILTDMGEMFICQGKEGVRLSRAIVSQGGFDTKKQVENLFYMRNELNGASVPFDTMKWLFDLLGMTVLSLLGGYCAIYAWKNCGNETTFWGIAIWGSIVVVVISFMALFFTKNFYLPAELVPGRWSDFDFWNRALKDEWSRIMMFVSSKHCFLDSMFWKAFCKGVAYYGLAMIVSISLLFVVNQKGAIEQEEGDKR